MALSACARLSASPEQSVHITADPISVTNRDLGKLPADAQEEAFTQWFYHCVPHLEVDAEREQPIDGGGFTGSITVKSVEIKLTAEIIIFQVKGEKKKVVDHELGHVEICKYFYKTRAPNIAKQCALAMIGRKFSGRSDSASGARFDAIDKARRFFCEQYKQGAADEAQKLSVRYDELTNHGLNQLPSDQAMQKILGLGQSPQP